MKGINLRIFKIEFDPMWPVPSGLIIAAMDEEQAMDIAKETIEHTIGTGISEIKLNEPKVIFYESGDY